MPRYNMTGPMGRGPFTGRGLGYCASRVGQGFMRCGFGKGMGRGMGYGRNFYPAYSIKEEKEFLEDELRFLEEEINSIKDAIERLKEE